MFGLSVACTVIFGSVVGVTHSRRNIASSLISSHGRSNRSGKADEAPVPFYFKVGVWDAEEAAAKWAATLGWRKEEGVDTILDDAPSWDFESVAQLMPTGCIHGRDRQGNLVVFDRWGGVDVAGLHERGVTIAQLLRHYIWQLEWLWTVAAPNEEELITLVMDLGGVSFDMITPANAELVKERVRIGCEHWPNRGAGLIMVNVPAWSSIAYRAVSPLLTESTKSKLEFISTEELAQGALLRLIPAHELPREYGGSSEVPLGQSSWDVAQLERARRAIRERDRKKYQRGALVAPWSVSQAKAKAEGGEPSVEPVEAGKGAQRNFSGESPLLQVDVFLTSCGEWLSEVWEQWQVEPSERDWEVWEI